MKDFVCAWVSVIVERERGTKREKKKSEMDMNSCQIGNYNIADPIVTNQYKKGREKTDRKR